MTNGYETQPHTCLDDKSRRDFHSKWVCHFQENTREMNISGAV